MSNEPAIEANFQLSFEQRQRTQIIEEWCDEYPDGAAHLIIGYADRLARLEDGIRALADKYHNADAKQPGAVVRADTFESELRALLDD